MCKENAEGPLCSLCKENFYKTSSGDCEGYSAGNIAKSIAEANGTAVVLMGLGAHFEDTEVQRKGLDVLSKLAEIEDERKEIGKVLIQNLQTCEESLRGSWRHILSRIVPKLGLPANQKINDWTKRYTDMYLLDNQMQLDYCLEDPEYTKWLDPDTVPCYIKDCVSS